MEGEGPKYEDIKSIDYVLMKLKEARGVGKGQGPIGWVSHSSSY